MPFGFLSKPAATLQVRADKRVCLPGDAIGVTVVAGSAKDLAVQECFAELLCAGQYRVVGARGDVPFMPTNDWLQTWAGHRAASGLGTAPGQHLRLKKVVSGESLLVRDMPQTYRASFEVPADMPPSFEGQTVKIAWGVRAGLLPRKGKEVNSLLSLTVLSPLPEAASPEGEEQPAFTNEDCSITISMPSRALLGGKVSGTVQIMPHREFSAARLEAVLAYSEGGAAGGHAGRTIRCEEQVELAKKLELRVREAARFVFNLTLPSAPRPSMSFPFALNRWWVRGTLWLDSNHQYDADHPLQVYSPPYTGMM